jgi:hypothetical protein
MEFPKPAESEPSQEAVPSKRDRLEKIIAILANGPTCRSLEEAHGLVHATFEAVENSYTLDRDEKMDVFELEFMSKLPFEGRTVYFEEFKRHILFIAENGAFDIRVRNEKDSLKALVKSQPTYAKQHLQSVLEKPGFDGKGVWD